MVVRMTTEMERSILRIQQYFQARQPMPLMLKPTEVLRIGLQCIERTEQIEPIRQEDAP